MKHKLAIVTGGGGMDCSYSAGALYGLGKSLELKPDILAGSSGSTGSLAYYASEQYDSIKRIWTKLLTSKKLISLKRLNRIIDIDFLIDIVFKEQEPLDAQKICDSNIKLFISATEYDTGKQKFFTNNGKYDIFEALRASKSVPLLFNKKVNIKGINYIDGSISSPLQANITKAIKEGARNLIVIDDEGKMSLSNKLFWSFYSLFVNKGLKKSVESYIQQRSADMEIPDNINSLIIGPNNKLPHTPVNNSKEALGKKFKVGYQDVTHNKDIQSLLNSF